MPHLQLNFGVVLKLNQIYHSCHVSAKLAYCATSTNHKNFCEKVDAPNRWLQFGTNSIEIESKM